jgi:RNA polymerase sigma-70 factor (ECF subfamily)
LERALGCLSPDHRAVLELTYYLGHSCGEIAAIMDCPINTVKTRMFHARNKLRALLPVLAAPEGSRVVTNSTTNGYGWPELCRAAPNRDSEAFICD